MVGVIDYDTGKCLKHYAQDSISRARYIIIALQNETDPDTCSVVDIDALDAEMRSELVNFVNSAECQKTPEIWKVLDTKCFMNYPKASMLKVLKALKQIKVVKSAQVAVQCPDDVIRTPKDILEGLKVYYEKNKNKSFNINETSVEKSEISEQKVAEQKEEINELKNEINSIKDNISVLTSSISDLVKALSESKKGE